MMHAGNPGLWRLALVPLVIGVLIIASRSDMRSQRLPDSITLFLASWGMVAAATGTGLGVSPRIAGLGYAAGWATPVLLDLIYRFRRGRSGIGNGDVKLMSAIGAWVGPWWVVPVWCGASVAAILWGVLRRRPPGPFPFGPWIAGSAAIAILVSAIGL